MDKKKKDKTVKLSYEFDRLGFKKMSLVYALFVPVDGELSGIVEPITKADETSSDIHQSVFGTTKGGTKHRESG